MAATPEEIVSFDEVPPPPGQSAYVDGHGPGPVLPIAEPASGWRRGYRELRDRIVTALGDHALSIEHVGSTSVPGLPAKPIIDIDLTVADPADEAGYVPALEAVGYVLVVREPWWHGHRCLRLAEPASNLHVFGPDSPELVRHRIFRDWLIDYPEDREVYAAAKRAAAASTAASGGHVMDYNDAKQAVVREIYARAFRAAGWLSPEPESTG